VTASDPALWAAARLDQAAAAALPVIGVAERLSSNLETGLAASEARDRLRSAGPNDLGGRWRPPSLATVTLRQMRSKLIWILIFATAVSFALGEWIDGLLIGVTLAVAIAAGTVNEYRSERAIASLRELTARRAEVIRDGMREEIPAFEVVPGDLVVVDEGDVVPADARVVDSRGMLVNESMLTGEPVAVPKVAEPSDEPGPTAPSMIYAGAIVAAGSATAIVVATGNATVLGSITRAVGSAGRRPTPLEERLEELGNRLIAAFLLLTALIVAAGLLQGRDARLVVETAIALAIGAVPEGLPVVATVSLAIAVRRLARARVLVRHLDSVETLGSTTVIVTDKTGTLTENRMTVRSVVLPGGETVAVRVEAVGGGLRTTLADGNRPQGVAREEAARRVLLLAALASDAVVERDDERDWHTHGDPSEGALVLAAAGLGYSTPVLNDQFPRIGTEPFTSATRMMRTLHNANGARLEAIKGALEPVAAYAGARDPALAAQVRSLSAAGHRVLAIAERIDDGPPRLAGAVVLEDPVRADAAEAVAGARAAGLKVMLVTGDHIETARTVASRAGILVPGHTIILGSEIARARLEDVDVVARASYAEKEAIVRALQRQREVVAMMGDGVNDAPSLKAADVGVAVGPAASDVAIDAADIVVADGRLFSLVAGIHEGRQVTSSLRRAIVYLLTASFATITLIGIGTLAGRPLALAPLQILWLNMVVHVFPAVALATTPQPGHTSDRPTRKLFTGATWVEISVRAVGMGLAGLAVLVLADRAFDELARIQATVFAVVAVGLVGQAFLIGVRHPREQPARLRSAPLLLGTAASLLLMVAALYGPGLRGALDLASPGPGGWAMAGLAVLIAWNVTQLGVLALTRGEPEGVA
jgi:Ca2+-transporting ATPase